MATLGGDWVCDRLRLEQGQKSLELKWVPACEFVMGSPTGEPGRNPDEGQFRVRLTYGFWIGVYLVTQAQFQAVAGRNPSKFTASPDNPVEMVSWDDAVEFCDRLNDICADQLPDGYRFSLPTEAQWELCCRAGTTSAFPFGETLAGLDLVAWHAGNSGDTTHPVGQKSANPWGLFDMVGNLMEWVYDGYQDYPLTFSQEWCGISSENLIVSRSSSFRAYETTMFRSACRGYTETTVKRPWFGFRVALRKH